MPVMAAAAVVEINCLLVAIQESSSRLGWGSVIYFCSCVNLELWLRAESHAPTAATQSRQEDL